MTITRIQVSLLIGKVMPTPAPAALMAAFQSATVRQSDDGAARYDQGFQLHFAAQRGPGQSRDYALLESPLLKPGNRVVLSVTINATPQVLMDGIITDQELQPSQGGAGGLLTVSGKDLSYLMDLVEMNISYPGLGDAAIAELILAKYAPLGIIPMVIPPLSSWVSLPTQQVPFQEGTDRDYLRRLAQTHGYIFSILPGPTPLVSQAYWGPLLRARPPQRAITADMGSATNVESISFGYVGQSPTQVYGLLAEPNTPVPVPILMPLDSHLPTLASEQPLLSQQPYVRKTRSRYHGTNVAKALAEARSTVNDSTADVVTAKGTLDALRYGDVLQAPGIVGVRGAGHSYDGLYYVGSVDHEIGRGSYKQKFKLSREGPGSTTMQVRP